MGEQTGIEWCHHTFNPWRGCEKVSEACRYCYAERLSQRNPAVWGEWGPRGKRVVAADSTWREPLKWNRKAQAAGERRRVFCASLADVFEDRPDLIAPRARLFDLIRETPHLDWLLLTKRPENIAEMLPDGWGKGWPNVWLGTSVEDQETADERVPALLRKAAAVRFLSCEPLLGKLDLARWLTCQQCHGEGICYRWAQDAYGPPGAHRTVCPCRFSYGYPAARGIDWVIVGGESGPSARVCDGDWMRHIDRDCLNSGVPLFVKQLGAAYSDPENGIAGRSLEVDPDAEALVSRRLRHPKGGDISEWPAPLRVQEIPESPAARLGQVGLFGEEA